ncbi:MAG: asparagine synthetase A [Candidatus Saccharicenans sp.]|nr:asparagine synthetase A [Candidatus Saccharicenans sp.]
MIDISQVLQDISSSELHQAIQVQTKLVSLIREILLREKFVELLPVIISPLTDPLTDFRVRGEVECYGFKYQITKSMIFHKQMAVKAFPRIFCFSPNVRIEPAERRDSGRHLIEFVQLDLEVGGATREEVIELGEKLFSNVIEGIKGLAGPELTELGRKLPNFTPPFERITYEEAVKTYGEDFELKLSSSVKKPVWLVDFPIEIREFYDREYGDRPGILVDMDLIYPEGYGEALSGGEREYQVERIQERIRKKGIDPEAYTIYLKLAESGLYPSAGFGFGIERLTRFVCGLGDIGRTRLFAKKPGQFTL